MCLRWTSTLGRFVRPMIRNRAALPQSPPIATAARRAPSFFLLLLARRDLPLFSSDRVISGGGRILLPSFLPRRVFAESCVFFSVDYSIVSGQRWGCRCSGGASGVCVGRGLRDLAYILLMGSCPWLLAGLIWVRNRLRCPQRCNFCLASPWCFVWI